MRADFSQTSEFYFAIANLLAHLEQHAPGTFDVMDGGVTVDIAAETLTQLRADPTWQQLEAAHANVGGCVNTQESDWEIIEGGIQLNDLAEIFKGV
jgi:hypothetical protein